MSKSVVRLSENMRLEVNIIIWEKYRKIYYIKNI